jgi:hypothetical protein
MMEAARQNRHPASPVAYPSMLLLVPPVLAGDVRGRGTSGTGNEIRFEAPPNA